MNSSILFIIDVALITLTICTFIGYLYEKMKNNVLSKEIQLCENKVRSWEKTLKDREEHFAEVSKRADDIQESVTKFRKEFDNLRSEGEEFYAAGQRLGDRLTSAKIYQRIKKLSEETEDILVSNTLRILATLLALESYNTTEVPTKKFVNLTLSSKWERLNDYQIAGILSKFKRSIIEDNKTS